MSSFSRKKKIRRQVFAFCPGGLCSILENWKGYWGAAFRKNLRDCPFQPKRRENPDSLFKRGMASYLGGSNYHRFSFSRDNTGEYQQDFKEKMNNVYIFEDHDQALKIWKKKGLKDLNLVHVDAHIDFGFPQAEPLEAVLAQSRSVE